MESRQLDNLVRIRQLKAEPPTQAEARRRLPRLPERSETRQTRAPSQLGASQPHRTLKRQ
jgi:hypothetical protein